MLKNDYSATALSYLKGYRSFKWPLQSIVVLSFGYAVEGGDGLFLVSRLHTQNQSVTAVTGTWYMLTNHRKTTTTLKGQCTNSDKIIA